MPLKDPDARRVYNRAYQRRWYQVNKEKHKASVARSRRRRIERFQEFKQGLKCNRCGEGHIACLEFHHLDPDAKEQSIARACRRWSWEHLMAEVAKCEVLCANCHRKHHHFGVEQ